MPMLTFSANIVSGGVSVPYTFNALFDPGWSSGRYSRHFHGITGSTMGDGGDSDFSAIANAPEEEPTSKRRHHEK
jgi:hypothetical protein